MSLPASSYPSSAPIPAQQVAQGSPNAANSQAPAQTQAPQAMPTNMTANNVSQGDATGAVANLASMQTPDNRQAYINNSNLPGMQTNYDQMVQTLANYDKNVIAPNYTAPTAANTPSDATSFGQGPLGVAASPLELTPSVLASPNFNFVNPDLAIQSQTAQKSNISDLLGTLGASIAKEFKSREGTYASTVQSQKDVVGFIKDLLDQQNQNSMKQMEMGIQKMQLDRQLQSEFQAQAEKVAGKLKSGDYSTSGNPQDAWGSAFNELKNFAQSLGLYGTTVTDNDINSQLGGAATLDQKTGKWTATGNASPNALTSFAYNNKVSSPQYQAQGIASMIDDTLKAFNNISPAGKLLPQFFGGADATTVNNNKQIFLQEIDKMASGRYNQQEMQKLADNFFNPVQSPDKASASAAALKDYLKTTTGIDFNVQTGQASGNSDQGSQRPPLNSLITP